MRTLEDLVLEAVTLLDSVGESSWSSRLRSALATGVVNRDAALSWFGGMGSFSDLVISPVNGHRCNAEEGPVWTAKLEALREGIFLAARTANG
jgi:hypothetical protein